MQGIVLVEAFSTKFLTHLCSAVTIVATEVFHSLVVLFLCQSVAQLFAHSISKNGTLFYDVSLTIYELVHHLTATYFNFRISGFVG